MPAFHPLRTCQRTNQPIPKDDRMIDARGLLRRLGKLSVEQQEIVLGGCGEGELLRFDGHWPSWAHEGQIPPHDDWTVWVMLAGRGFGKTRAGAEWVSQHARENPDARLALVGATPEEARAVMVEGRSGLIAAARGRERDDLVWEPSLGRLRFASGAEAQVFSGSNPDSLRGPEHHLAWCDELANWRRAQETWDNLRLGLRAGDRPRVLVTTTPRSLPVLTQIIGDEETVRTGGATWDNPHAGRGFVAAMKRQHGGTRFGRQELEGELIAEVEGALWPRELIEACRTGPHPNPLPQAGEGAFRCVVVGVDPPAGPSTGSGQGRGDACGIVAVGLGRDGIGYVLGDHSVGGLSPEGWARKVAAAAEAHGAAKVVAEANNGGRMVEAVLRGAGVRLPVRLVHAAEGKVARAAPVAALFESGKARFAGAFPALEDELAALSWSGDYQGPGRSPDRADAMVWALTELMLGKSRAEPRVMML
jgi:predicted phage terminase large subunit-like protein